jgi:ferritin-like metal-binding protein YciE
MAKRKTKARHKADGSGKSQTHKELTQNDKMIIYLNEALAIENAAIPRLQARIKQVSIESAKAQLTHHLEETTEQQDRLRQLIVNLGGTPTRDKARLPIPEMPKRISNVANKSITSAEQELKSAKEDSIIENAEVVMYDTLLQLTQQMGVNDAIPSLTQNLSEEREMADWLRGNMPVIITELYPKIEESMVAMTQDKQTTIRITEA